VEQRLLNLGDSAGSMTSKISSTSFRYITSFCAIYLRPVPKKTEDNLALSALADVLEAGNKPLLSMQILFQKLDYCSMQAEDGYMLKLFTLCNGSNDLVKNNLFLFSAEQIR